MLTSFSIKNPKPTKNVITNLPSKIINLKRMKKNSNITPKILAFTHPQLSLMHFFPWER